MEGWGIRALELWADGPGRADRRTLPVTLLCGSVSGRQILHVSY